MRWRFLFVEWQTAGRAATEDGWILVACDVGEPAEGAVYPSFNHDEQAFFSPFKKAAQVWR